ncbi:hypothetical protein J6590_072102 [Homalodisca vitripennis]|nr:hypothetical protein J6590_072102 [Homalodisca vitripennis]
MWGGVSNRASLYAADGGEDACGGGKIKRLLAHFLNCRHFEIASEPQFEVSGVHCPLPSDSLAPQTLHYESSRSCIAPPPDDSVESTGPCYLGICLPQHIIDLFPVEELPVRPEDPHLDNASTTGMDVSSCDSETDTGPEGEADRSMTKPRPVAKRRHDRTSCLLCSVSKIANPRQTRWRKISASSHRTRTETESSYGGAGNDGESPVMVQWQSKGGLEGITSVDSSSTDITTAISHDCDIDCRLQRTSRQRHVNNATEVALWHLDKATPRCRPKPSDEAKVPARESSSKVKISNSTKEYHQFEHEQFQYDIIDLDTVQKSIGPFSRKLIGQAFTLTLSCTDCEMRVSERNSQLTKLKLCFIDEEMLYVYHVNIRPVYALCTSEWDKKLDKCSQAP